MNIKVSINLHMSDEQLQSWANEYGLSADEVEADAHGTISDIIREHVEQIYHVAEFTTITRYTVK